MTNGLVEEERDMLDVAASTRLTSGEIMLQLLTHVYIGLTGVR
jgi:hypothetical protein